MTRRTALTVIEGGASSAFQDARVEAVARAELICALDALYMVESRVREAAVNLSLAVKAEAKDRRPLIERARDRMRLSMGDLMAVLAELPGD